MKKILSNKKKRTVFLIVNAALLLIAAASFLVMAHLAKLLPSQRAAERWQGESDMEFAQISCYIPVDEKVTLSQIYAFRYAMLDKFHEAALDIDNDESLFVDAWCTTAKVNASTSIGRGEAKAIAVGGEFFHFHPIRLLNGNYLSENDLMKDRVLLDEELAWLLFGGTDLQGLELRLNGTPFVVGGVIQREDDFASKKAYTDGMGLYMSYDAYALLDENAGITCYELVMPEPVDHFAVNFAREKFPIGRGQILQNTGRFAFGHLLSLLGQFGSRSMQTLGVIYPYWENAARSVEDWCSLLLLQGFLFALLPGVSLLVLLIGMLKKGKTKMADDVLPQLKDKTEEAIRVRQRRRWEKRHGAHEKK